MDQEAYEALKEIPNRREILNPLRDESLLSETFHENTKLTRLNAPEYQRRIENVVGKPELVQMIRKPHKRYSVVEERLSLPAVPPSTELERVIHGRRSVRSFSGAPVTADELARLLFYAYGRTGDPPAPDYFRAVPSGGALYPLELYPIVLRGDGVPEGICHYNAEHHRLELLRGGDVLPRLKEVLHGAGIDLDHAAVVVVLSAVLRRNLFKYHDRGYRMVLMEAGEVAQSLALQASSMGMGSVMMGGFFDDELARLLGLDEVSEPCLLPVVLGRPQGSGE
jgi:SagB-type dehydrogenase family enzyme